MKKILGGLLGTVVGSAIGSKESVRLGNLKFYDYLRQALIELLHDERYEIYLWDCRAYSPSAAKRIRREGRPYLPEIIKRPFIAEDEIAFSDVTISLEYGLKTNKREIYVRLFNFSRKAFDELEEVRTPSEIQFETKLPMRSGQYSNNGKIYYLMDYEGLGQTYSWEDVFGYYKEINSRFDALGSE